MALGPILTDYLTRSGLKDLIPWASQMIINGASEDEILLDMENQPAFRQRFWMIFSRHDAGYPPVSVSEVLEYEQTATEMARAFGVNLTMQEIGQNIANNRSVAELQDVIGIASQAVHLWSDLQRDQFERLYNVYGITDDDMVRYWLDPKKQAPVLQRRFAAVAVATQAARSGFGEISAPQAEELVRGGVDEQAAQSGFGALVEMGELFEGVDQTEEDIDTDQQLSLLTGNAELAQQVERRGQKRVARFQEGGGFATGREGVSGLGSASR